MQDDREGGAPALQEETRAARGRLAEQLISVVVVTVLFGTALNLGTTLLVERFNGATDFWLMIACAGLGTVLLIVFVPRISTSVKEFHEELEIALPLLVSPQNVEVARTIWYDEVTELAHAALNRRSAEERRALAEALRATADDAAARALAAQFVVEMAQVIFTAQFLRASRALLGRTAWYGPQRAIARMQDGVDSVDVASLAPVRDGKPGNRFLRGSSQGLPEKALTPRGMRIALPAPTLAHRPRRRGWRNGENGPEIADADEVTILRAWSGQDSDLQVCAYADFSEYGAPSPGQPGRGFTARCFLRNTKDTVLRTLATEEEEAARRALAPDHTPDDLQCHRDICQRLAERSAQPRILRVFARMDGSFRVRLLSNERRQRGRYAWGAAVSRELTRIDVGAFLATLREHGQQTPRARG